MSENACMKSWLAALALLLCAGSACALVTVDEIQVPVKVANAFGREVEHSITVGLFSESSAPKPYPLLVLNHGRAANAADLVKTKVADYAAAARWLTGFGFLVAVPIRVGYGVTGGPDVENSGDCRSKNYPPVYHAAAAQTLAVLAQLRAREDAARDRAVVMGQSFGGTTAIAVAALNPPGVQATVNFAGGGGGNPDERPMNPCGADRLKSLFEGYGRTARLPTLWLYSENDLYWGPKLPVEWFEAFKAAGGQGEFAAFPPVSDNGHRLFSRAPQLWQPRVREFLIKLGYPPLN
jgi:dienelactone hydrolase